MLYDKEFLLELDKWKHKTIYARITSLRFDETPIESIEGRVTGGSINLDGASALRRTCSLSMTAEEFNHSSYTWGLNTKFKLEIGVKNFINPVYPDIIWFNQGIYLITSFSTSNNTNSFNVSISGKDKMCLLNGEIGGSLESSVDFGTIEEENADGVWVIRKLPIPDIIRNLIHTYAREPYHNIIINDLDAYGLELLEYRYETPMFLYSEYNEDDIIQPLYKNAFLQNNTMRIKLTEEGEEYPLSIFDDTENENYESYLQHLDPLIDGIGAEKKVLPVWVKDGGSYKKVILTRLSYGDTAGYRQTDLTYAGDLIANVGESITSVLDKIRNMLVEFEYFYDVDGRFIFQKKQSYTSTLWGGDSTNEEPEHCEAVMLSSATAYTFSGGELITAFNNTPNLTNLRNDYSIWGERTSISGAKLPVHMRYAIDTKPVQYTSIEVDDEDEQLKAYNEKHGTNLKGQSKVLYKAAKEDEVYTVEIEDDKTTITCDWREIIYQMAKDYYKYNILDNFEIKIIEANKDYYPTGITGYEAYYIDIQGFWRQLYNPEIGGKLTVATEELNGVYNEDGTLVKEGLIHELEKKQAELKYAKAKALAAENVVKAMDQSKEEDEEMESEEAEPPVEETAAMAEEDEAEPPLEEEIEPEDPYMKAYGEMKDAQIIRDNLAHEVARLEENKATLEKKIEDYTNTKANFNTKHWNIDIEQSPQTLNFWFDFLDTEGELQQFNVKTIGARPKAINDTNVKSIYFRDTPDVLFFNLGETPPDTGAYTCVQAPEEMFSISGQGKSAKDRLDELIYQHGYCIESASITAIPIYYLEPNVRVYVYDEKTGIDGEYVISKITLPLTYNGTMSLTATKAAETLF